MHSSKVTIMKTTPFRGGSHGGPDTVSGPPLPSFPLRGKGVEAASNPIQGESRPVIRVSRFQ
ncbi:MAG: hypothetical protein CMJ23_01055 [Phycisphaerae bacterium]|nr:hypothetical protein [Phycisphaerae bacterium]